MILNAYAVFDEKALAYNNPFYFAHDGQATRAFMDEISNDSSMLSKHPEDYKLYRLGQFDTTSGKLDAVKEPVFLMHASQVKTQKEG